MPPSQTVTIRWPNLHGLMAEELGPLRAEHARLINGLRVARTDLTDLQNRGARDARRADEQATAVALRAGKPLPEPKATKANDAAIADAQRLIGGLYQAVADVEAEVRMKMLARSDAYAADLSERRTVALVEADASLAAASSSLDNEGDLESSARWLAGAKIGRVAHASKLPAPSGSLYSVPDALGGVRAYVTDALSGAETAEDGPEVPEPTLDREASQSRTADAEREAEATIGTL